MQVNFLSQDAKQLIDVEVPGYSDGCSQDMKPSCHPELPLLFGRLVMWSHILLMFTHDNGLLLDREKLYSTRLWPNYTVSPLQVPGFTRSDDTRFPDQLLRELVRVHVRLGHCSR